MPRYILTGGPGAGKTSLLDELRTRGFSCSEEVSRKLIRTEAAVFSTCLPWNDLCCFADKCLEQMLKEIQNYPSGGLTFFDRGIPDIIAYLRLAGIPVKEKFLNAEIEPAYERTVFILPPWKEIYTKDAERWQSAGESALIYECLFETYTSLKYKLVEVPRLSLAGRVEFISNHIQRR